MAVGRGDRLQTPGSNPVTPGELLDGWNVAILVPRRDDGGWRDRLWRYVRARLERELPDWPIHEGHHDDGPFNRAAAINTAAELAGDWEIALIVDGDTLAPPEALQTGALLAATHGYMVNCHDLRVMLKEQATRRIIESGRLDPVNGWRKPQWVERIWYESPSAGVAVRRDLYDRVGGFDERFVGWGHEDSAFRHACETLSGAPMLRVAMDCYHLWHPESPEVDRRSPTRRANMARLADYEHAAGDVTLIDRLTGGPL